MPNRERSYKITFRVTEEERNYINEKIKRLGFRFKGAYFRKMVIDGRIFNIDNTPLREMNSKMTRVNSNINQIAKRVNSTSNIYQEDLLEIKEMVSEIWQLQKSILSKLP